MVIINSIKFGSITIDGKTYHEDIIVTWDNEVKEIYLTVRHYFALPEFNQITKTPDVLIVGTGLSGLCGISDDVRKICKERGIKLIMMASGEAIKRFNEAFNQGKKVAAFIHITC